MTEKLTSPEAAPLDRLAAMFDRVRISARVFHTGPVCGIEAFGQPGGPGHVHVLRAGCMAVDGDAMDRATLQAPTAILFGSNRNRGAARTAAANKVDWTSAGMAGDEGVNR